MTAARGLDLAASAGVRWVRRNGLLWASVEPHPGARSWAAVSGLESELQAAHELGLEVILVIRDTPAWAQAVPGYACGPVAPQALDTLAQFAFDAVKRYGSAPYGVKHWELWNEPDVAPELVAPDSGYGCWGDSSDPYYGGGAYAQMLQAVYPAIKAADPEAKVLLGGLLLASEPGPDDPVAPGRFLEGVLRAGGGDYFDVTSFHGYAQFWNKLVDWEMQIDAWAPRGGVIAGKASFLREVLAGYGYDKPLILTESGLLCPSCGTPPGEAFLAAQAAYVPRLYVRNGALGLIATVWYTLEGPGWRNGGLLEGAQQPRPAFRAFETLNAFLGKDCVLADDRSQANLAVYVHQCPGDQVWVLWTKGNESRQYLLPAGFVQAFDHFGTPIPLGGGSISAGFAPIYLRITPP